MRTSPSNSSQKTFCRNGTNSYSSRRNAGPRFQGPAIPTARRRPRRNSPLCRTRRSRTLISRRTTMKISTAELSSHQTRRDLILWRAAGICLRRACAPARAPTTARHQAMDVWRPHALRPALCPALLSLSRLLTATCPLRLHRTSESPTFHPSTSRPCLREQAPLRACTFPVSKAATTREATSDILHPCRIVPVLARP